MDSMEKGKNKEIFLFYNLNFGRSSDFGRLSDQCKKDVYFILFIYFFLLAFFPCKIVSDFYNN